MSDSANHAPDPLRELPPADQFCDLVLNGGVASGVVYPWALLELARHYRFKSIGGNSVGALAAALAAAAEYGRCNGVENAFEPLRRTPLDLAEEKDGKTGMLRLFQPSPPVQRLFDLFLEIVKRSNKTAEQDKSENDNRDKPGLAELLKTVLRIYKLWRPLVMLVALLVSVVLLAVWVYCEPHGVHVRVLPLALLLALGCVLKVLRIGACRVHTDLKALAANGYGLCTGRRTQDSEEEGFAEWLHRGVQLSAGRGRDDPPLTFADLWAAPRFGRAGPVPLPGGLQPLEPGVNLQMFCSNVTQGRPVRLPLNDANTRLYYLPKEWAAYFPPPLMRALEQASTPYLPISRSDPDQATLDEEKRVAERQRLLTEEQMPLNPDQKQLIIEAQRPQIDEQIRHIEEQKLLLASIRELPSGGMPIVVAARLSMSFPLLFSCVPVYAVDYEMPQGKRRLRRCLLSDGGLCTNFPVHLFDAAHPRWPTFGFLLDSRLKIREDSAVWRPETHLEGRVDNWHRFVPGAEDEGEPARPLLKQLIGLLDGIILTMKDWNDRVTGRLPQVRNRIIRLALQDGEGQLNLAMPSKTILHMAREYGTQSGKDLWEAFAPDGNGVKPAWREHVYVRSIVELRALRGHLCGYARAAQARGSTLPLHELLDDAKQGRPLADRPDRPDPAGAHLSADQRNALDRATRAVQVLEAELSACEPKFGPYLPVAEPELRLRPPL